MKKEREVRAQGGRKNGGREGKMDKREKRREMWKGRNIGRRKEGGKKKGKKDEKEKEKKGKSGKEETE